MKKFDPENLSLSAIAIVVFPAIIMLFIWIWIAGKPYDYDGARVLAVDNNGVTHIQVEKSLYRIAPDGAALPTIDLAELGVTDFIGDMTFNEQNELLLRRGSYQTGFLENLSIYYRVSNKRPVNGEQNDGMSLCNLYTRHCRNFPELGVDFNRGFFSDFNPQNESLIVSDASRHLVRALDNSGQQLAILDHGLQFPNDVLVTAEHWYLVDTNHKVIKQFNHGFDPFGDLKKQHVVDNVNAAANGHHFPYSIEKVDDQWWVIMLDHRMNKGGVYLFDNQWNYLKALELDGHEYPVALVKRQSDVLLTDINGQNVLRYSTTGELLGFINHRQLNVELVNRAEQRRFYEQLKCVYLKGIGLLVLAITMYVLWRRKKSIEAELNEQKENTAANKIIVDSGLEQQIEWIPRCGLLASLEQVRKIQTTAFLLITAFLAVSIFYTQTYLSNESNVLLPSRYFLMFAFLLCAVLLLSEQARVRMGVYKKQLILHDQIDNKAYAATGENILFDGRFISFGTLSAKTIRNGQSAYKSPIVYEMAAYTRLVYPCLASATVIEPRAMLAWKRGQFSSTGKDTLIKWALLVVSLLVYGAVTLLLVSEQTGKSILQLIG